MIFLKQRTCPQTLLKQYGQDVLLQDTPFEFYNSVFVLEIYFMLIPHICHESHENSRVNFFWPV